VKYRGEIKARIIGKNRRNQEIVPGNISKRRLYFQVGFDIFNNSLSRKFPVLKQG